MKVAVINYSGSVRKTLISSYLLEPDWCKVLCGRDYQPVCFRSGY
jgi:hypothetical protein